MIDFYLVDVKSISSDVPRSNFSESNLEKLADSILASGGIIKPLVLKETGVEEFSVIDGHLEYYAAVKAREKNPRQGEMVNAFVISPKVEDLVIEQTALLKNTELNTTQNYEQEVKASTSKTKSQTLPSNQLSSLEKQMSDLRIELVQEIQRLYSAVNQPKKFTQADNLTPLEAFNKLNVRDLIARLKTVNYPEKRAIEVAEKIEKERSNQAFTSLADIVERIKLKVGKSKKETKAISEKKMLQIVDTWSEISFNKEQH
ncbi:hypothetical protein DSM106972_057250 [Dulcicalothrix desertica PCC 7102]|uniref:ParB-like N-terminal domain-containing protein n=1 Tax=Dulcicalothrix desertica PCC 7102 TaxID=232991 RepID=A0A3S1AK82_9CYAN|nr:ParB N-terminal domain-containing protein [Dulcicalothrix desertica]RUT02805.1 hypothetical protein DSM106972_057250 [Dulcicalothrix desertica PCC 7102]TWH38961.1 hypothetical protein CAL7102_08163 [Dulcicalothrix desertica PCC 7102]